MNEFKGSQDYVASEELLRHGLQSSCPHFTAAGLCGDGRCGASVHR